VLCCGHASKLVFVLFRRFVYCESMGERVAFTDVAVAGVAAVIGDPTRARMLLSLMDGRARTGTELGSAAEVSPSTASVHLHRLQEAGLVTVRRQGRHRYYTLSGGDVANLLENLSAIAGGKRQPWVSRTPQRLRDARTCYDHLAGTLAVALCDRFAALGWLTLRDSDHDDSYDLSASGMSAFTALGIDVPAARALHRRFAFGCLDWSERRYHLGGALGAAFLGLARSRKWLLQDLDSRAVRVTELGRRELLSRLGVSLECLGNEAAEAGSRGRPTTTAGGTSVPRGVQRN
jgi:DNA-binding transcriptional ArsR family regulator